MALGLGRLRYGHTQESAVGLDAFKKMRIRAEGPTVVASMVVEGGVIEKGLWKFVRGLSKGFNRIRRGPGYPS